MKLECYSLKNGSSAGSVEVSDGIFGSNVNDHLVYEAVRAELANARQGTAMAKARSEVSGSRSKLYRQKGTGRARAGYSQSPTRVGGGVAFGPRPRDYRIRLSKKVRQAAMVSLLSLKVSQGLVRVIEDFESETGKTKDMNLMLTGLTKSRRVVIIANKLGDKTKRAIRNIPWVRCYDSARLVYKDLFYAKEILVTKSAVADIESHYAGAVKGE
ncbi:MAG TPA: 50S ribosomal protein L4 [Spirochaetota bacterium]|nr:50S ribosomal protein L4 [Spirochaetota bacterium]